MENEMAGLEGEPYETKAAHMDLESASTGAELDLNETFDSSVLSVVSEKNPKFNGSRKSINLSVSPQTARISKRLKSLAQLIIARRKEDRINNPGSILKDNAAQQKEVVLKQSHSLQLDRLCKTTKFNKQELRWLYTGWKVACTDGCGVPVDLVGANDGCSSNLLPSAYYGIINESQFQQIYAQFFPYGGDCSFYAKYLFQAMFGDRLTRTGGFITFSDYTEALSDLLRGSVEKKIDFVFRLYDINGDNVITVDELSRIFLAVYRLLGDNVNQKHDQKTYEAEAEKFYRKIDSEQTGFITRKQFLEYCKRDPTIVDTIKSLEMSICSGA